MTTPVFIDTNVLLYFVSRDPAERDKQERAEKLLWSAPFATSVQVLQEFYVNATRVGGMSLPRSSALSLIEWCAQRPVVELDVSLLREATAVQERYQLSYWDAAIIAAANRLNCEVIYTEDLSDGQDYGGVRVRNPFL